MRVRGSDGDAGQRNVASEVRPPRSWAQLVLFRTLQGGLTLPCLVMPLQTGALAAMRLICFYTSPWATLTGLLR